MGGSNRPKSLEFCLCDYHSILRPHNILMAHSNIETSPWSEKTIHLVI